MLGTAGTDMMLGIDTMPENGWNDGIDGRLGSRHCRRQADIDFVAVVVAAFAGIAAAVDNSPQNQNHIHYWNWMPAAAAPHSRWALIAENRCYGCYVGWMRRCTPRRRN